MWRPQTLDDSRPVYVALADALAEDLRAGRLQPGERLPTHRQLAAALGVNVVTVTRGYAEAARRGLVEGTVGRGTFVRQRAEDRPALLRPAEGPPLIDFHFNLPSTDPSWLDLGPVFQDFAARPEQVPLFTGYLTHGLPEHRAAGARWIETAGVPADVDRVLVCGGAQQAMTLALSVLTRPGDAVLVERLTYPGMAALAGVLGLRPVPVPMDAEGLDPGAVGDLAERSGARVLYTMPTLHNPTGAVLSAERRRALVALARERDLALVEDDTYGFLCAQAPPPLAALAPERTWFVAATSKSLAAGLRIGYLQVPDPGDGGGSLVERTAAQVTAVGWMAAPVMAEIVARWIDTGAAERVIAGKRREVAARRALFDRLCGDARTESHPSSAHVWLPLESGWRAADAVARARERGLALASGEAFSVGGSPPEEALRVCLGTPPTRKQCERGLALLADLLAEGPGAPRALV